MRKEKCGVARMNYTSLVNMISQLREVVSSLDFPLGDKPCVVWLKDEGLFHSIPAAKNTTRTETIPGVYFEEKLFSGNLFRCVFLEEDFCDEGE